MASWFVACLSWEGVGCTNARRWPCHSCPVKMFGDEAVNVIFSCILLGVSLPLMPRDISFLGKVSRIMAGCR